MAKGRPRNALAKRQPDGSIRSYEDPAAATIARRIRDRLYSDARHEWYGFPLGIMFALKTISVEEFAAGKAWAAAKWRLSQMDGLMLPKCKAIDWAGPQGRRLAADPDENELNSIAKLRRRLLDLDGLISSIGFRASSIMARLCLGDEQLSPAEQEVARRALAKLAAARRTKG